MLYTLWERLAETYHLVDDIGYHKCWYLQFRKVLTAYVNLEKVHSDYEGVNSGVSVVEFEGNKAVQVFQGVKFDKMAQLGEKRVEKVRLIVVLDVG